jgi:hypothetical protein
MPISKEATIEQYRRTLEHNGIDTAGWFDQQLALSMLSGLLLFGWEKGLGGDDELAWWCERAQEGVDAL